MRSIAKRFDCKPDPLRRHKKHVAKLIVRRDRDLGGTLLQQMMQLTQRLEVMFHTARGTGDFSAMGAVIESQRKMLLSQHELISSVPVPQRDVKITVRYHDELALPTLRECGPFIVGRVPCPKLWTYLETHLKEQLPLNYAEVKRELDKLTPEELNDFRRELQEDVQSGHSAVATSQPN